VRRRDKVRLETKEAPAVVSGGGNMTIGTAESELRFA
jgi:hypothetical protein